MKRSHPSLPASAAEQTEADRTSNNGNSNGCNNNGNAQKDEDRGDEQRQTTTAPTNKSRRVICSVCDRPKPRACICEGLPKHRISLRRCRLLVLQHPHETKHKNRSLPLIELCLDHRCMHTITGRRLFPPDHPGLNDPQWKRHNFDIPRQWLDTSSGNRVILLFPDSNSAISLGDAMAKLDHDNHDDNNDNDDNHDDNNNDDDHHHGQSHDGGNRSEVEQKDADADSDKRITILVLDATWKFASEMHRKHLAKGDCYPNQMITVSLQPSDLEALQRHARQKQQQDQKIDAGEDGKQPSSQTPTVKYRPRRFDIRTPPSDDCMSTAEAIAWVVSRIEGNHELFDIFMKPLDVMVQKWNSFRNHKGSK